MYWTFGERRPMPFITDGASTPDLEEKPARVSGTLSVSVQARRHGFSDPARAVGGAI